MSITVRQEPALDLEGYSQVRMELTVRSRFRVEIVDGGLGGWTLNEEPVHPPFHKDYDEHWPPTEWVKFDLSNWALFAAFDGQHRVGGATVAWNSPGLNMLARANGHRGALGYQSPQRAAPVGNWLPAVRQVRGVGKATGVQTTHHRDAGRKRACLPILRRQGKCPTKRQYTTACTRSVPTKSSSCGTWTCRSAEWPGSGSADLETLSPRAARILVVSQLIPVTPGRQDTALT